LNHRITHEIGPQCSKRTGFTRVTILILIILVGIVAYLKLGRAEDPTFTIKVFTVTAAWPGATAEEMQNLVAAEAWQDDIHPACRRWQHWPLLGRRRSRACRRSFAWGRW